MTSESRIRAIFKQIDLIRCQLSINNRRVDEYLYYIHEKTVTKQIKSLLACGICNDHKNHMSSSFKRAFGTLSNLEKAQFYLLQLKNVDNIYRLVSQKIQKRGAQFEEKVKKIQLTLLSGSLFRKQKKVTVEVLWKLKILRVADMNIQIDLHNYLLRRSKNPNKISLVLESTVQQPPLGETLWIATQGLEFDDVINIISFLWEQAQYENVYELIGESRREDRGKRIKLKGIEDREVGQEKGEKENNRSLSTLETVQVEKNEIPLGLQKLLKIISDFGNQIKFEQTRYGQMQQKNGIRVRKRIHLRNYRDSKEVCEAITSINKMKSRKSNLVQLQIKQKKDNSSNLTNQIQQIYSFDCGSIKLVYNQSNFSYHGLLYILQIFQREKKKKSEGGLVDYCIWRIRELDQMFEVFVEAKIQYPSLSKNKRWKQYSSSFIGQLSVLIKENQNGSQCDTFHNQQISCINEQLAQQQFYTLPGSPSQRNIQLLIVEEEFQNLPIQTIKEVEKMNLKHKYALLPEAKGKPQYVRTKKGHWLFCDEWVLNQSGDLVSIDREKIEAQSNVLKLVVKRMSKNIFSGKSILNTSLPIEIFGTDSNLQRLANGYRFGPIFLEKAVRQSQPLERFKLSILFAFGFSLSYIKMDKPFNPILGETYQGLIDGCPVYAQQISHHPPITSLYMVGRGYKVYGSMQAKVQFSLNSAAGFNEGFNNIEFDDSGQKIKFTSPPGELSGVVFGQRKITVIKKSYYIDQLNHIYCEIDWGKNKTIKSELSKYNDFFHGRIVRMKNGTDFKNFKNIKKDQVECELGVIMGRFFDKAYFEGQEVFSIEKETPHKMNHYIPCLDSDSRYRKDLMARKESNLALAQEAKEEMEEIQRGDRKLRQQMKSQRV